MYLGSGAKRNGVWGLGWATQQDHITKQRLGRRDEQMRLEKEVKAQGWPWRAERWPLPQRTQTSCQISNGICHCPAMPPPRHFLPLHARNSHCFLLRPYRPCLLLSFASSSPSTGELRGSGPILSPSPSSQFYLWRSHPHSDNLHLQPLTATPSSISHTS